MRKIVEFIKKLNSKEGFAPILIVVAVALLAIPVTTLLVQKQQDIRQRAEGDLQICATTSLYYECDSEGSKGFKTKSQKTGEILASPSCPGETKCYTTNKTSSCISCLESAPPTPTPTKGSTTCWSSDGKIEIKCTPTPGDTSSKTPTQIHGVVTIGGRSEPIPQSMMIYITVNSPDDGNKYTFYKYDDSIQNKPNPYYSISDSETPTSIAGKQGNFTYTIDIYNSGNGIGHGSGGGSITFGQDNTLNMSVNVVDDAPTPTNTPTPNPTKTPRSSDSTLTPTPTGSSTKNDGTLPGSPVCKNNGGVNKAKYVEPRCAVSREDALAGGGKYDQAKARNGEFENKIYFDLYICADNNSLEAWPAGAGDTTCKTPPWTVKITPGAPTPTPELGVACLSSDSTCEANACSTSGKQRNPNGAQADEACRRANSSTPYCCLKAGTSTPRSTTPTPTSGTCYQRCDYDGTCGGTMICINHCCSNEGRPASKVGLGQTCEPGAIECEDWLKCIPTTANPAVHVCVPNGNPTPIPTTNPGGACSSTTRPDLGCPCNAGSCGFSGLACIMASGGGSGAGCCANVGQRWCPPTSGVQGSCVDYPYICPGGSSSSGNPNPAPTSTSGSSPTSRKGPSIRYVEENCNYNADPVNHYVKGSYCDTNNDYYDVYCEPSGKTSKRSAGSSC